MGERLTVVRCPYCGKQIGLNTVSYLTKLETKLSAEQVKDAISNWIEDLDVIEEEGSIAVIPKNYLGKEVWQEINNALKPFNPEWISAKKESRWVIKLQDEQ
jgi:DNA-directed RNA polymerase subunit N (RpoN/RPB10)